MSPCDAPPRGPAPSQGRGPSACDPPSSPRRTCPARRRRKPETAGPVSAPPRRPPRPQRDRNAPGGRHRSRTSPARAQSPDRCCVRLRSPARPVAGCPPARSCSQHRLVWTRNGQMVTRVRMICTPGHDYHTGRHSTVQNGGQKTVQTFDRAVAILDAFTPRRPELGVSEIARITGLSRSTVHRLLATLRRHELVQQIPGSRNYALGPHLLRLAQIAFSNVNLQDVAKVVMTELRDKCDETVGLHTQLGPFTRTVLDQVESRQQLRRTYG